MIRLRYLPPSGEPVDFDSSLASESGFQLTAGLDGLAGAGAQVSPATSPGQWGATAVGVTVTPRTATTVIKISAATHQAVWEARQQLAGALAQVPTRPGDRPELGVLRLTRQQLDEVETVAVPVGSPRAERWLSDRICEVEVEWWMPDPRWREVADRTVKLAAGGGFAFPLAHPWSSLGANISAEVANGGTVESPILARIYGPLTTPRLILLDTGQSIELTGEVASGEHLEVDTGFAAKQVVLVAADGTRTNAMGRINLDLADFWQLPPGTSQVRLEADQNPGGVVHLTWRNRWAGV